MGLFLGDGLTGDIFFLRENKHYWTKLCEHGIETKPSHNRAKHCLLCPGHANGHVSIAGSLKLHEAVGDDDYVWSRRDKGSWGP